MKNLPLLAVVLLVGWSPVRAQEEAIEPADVTLDRPVDFDRDIAPILRANCLACHNESAAENDLVVEGRAGLLKGGADGPAIVPGKPEESLLFKVAARVEEPVMPPLPNDVKAAALTPRQLGLLKLWIAEGAKASTAASGSQITWQALSPRFRAIYAVALDQQGRFAVAGRANRISVYDLVTGAESAELIDPQSKVSTESPAAAHRDFVQSLALHPDGDLLASGGYRVIKLWRRAAPQVVARLTTPSPLSSWATRGELTATAAADHVVVVRGRDGNEITRCTGHQSAVTAIAFGGTERLVSADASGMSLWNVTNGEQIAAQPLETMVMALAIVGTDKPVVVAGTQDKRLVVWRPGSGADAVAELSGHGDAVTCLTPVPGTAEQLMSGSQDGTVRLWDLAAGKQLRSYSLESPVTTITVSADGKRVAAAGANGTARIWDVGNGKQTAVCEKDRDGQRRVAELTRDNTVCDRRTKHRDGIVKATDKERQNQEAALKTSNEKLEAAKKAVTDAEGKEKAAREPLEAARKELEAKPEDEAVKKKVADLQKKADEAGAATARAVTAREAAEKDVSIVKEGLERARSELERQTALHTAAVNEQKEVAAKLEEARKAATPVLAAATTVRFSDATGARIATAHADGTLRTWNAATGTPIDVTALPIGDAALISADASVCSVRTGPQEIAVVSLARPWELAGTLGGSGDANDSPVKGRVLALDFSPDGRLLASGSGVPSREGQLQLWDVDGGTLIHDFTDAHSDSVLDVEFSHRGDQLLSCAADKFARVFDVESRKHVRSFEGHTHHVISASWQADGTTIATAGGDNVIKVWNTETGEQKRTITNYRKQVTGLQFVGVGETILSCSGDHTVRTHAVSNGRNLRTFGGTSDYMYAVAATPDETIVIAGGDDGVLRVWNGKDGKTLFSFAPPGPAATP